MIVALLALCLFALPLQRASPKDPVADRARDAAEVMGRLRERGFRVEASGLPSHGLGGGSLGTFFDPVSGFGGVWEGGGLYLLSQFRGPVDPAAVGARLTAKERNLFEGDLLFTLDLTGRVRMSAGVFAEGNDAESWKAATARMRQLAGLLGPAVPLSADTAFDTAASPIRALPPGFWTTSMSGSDIWTISRMYR